MTGSWAGAMGHTQFIPTTYAAYAVDFDGDGRRDIWNNIGDALASTANYLKKSGWQAGATWGYEVAVPKGFNYGLAKTERTLAAWRKLGVTRAGGKAFPRPSESARLFAPAGAKGPAFLLIKNFKVIKRYNNADAYALAVGHLSDRLRGGEAFTVDWPDADLRLSDSELVKVQELLAQRGLYDGDIDGNIGSGSRAAIMSYQETVGLTADGQVSQKLLEMLQIRPIAPAARHLSAGEAGKGRQRRRAGGFPSAPACPRCHWATTDRQFHRMARRFVLLLLVAAPRRGLGRDRLRGEPPGGPVAEAQQKKKRPAGRVRAALRAARGAAQGRRRPPRASSPTKRRILPIRKKSGPTRNKPRQSTVAVVEIGEKDPNAKKILVIGDYVGDAIAWGLDQALAKEPKLVVIERTNAPSGLIRSDNYDWNQELLGILNEENPDMVVVALGSQRPPGAPRRRGALSGPLRDVAGHLSSSASTPWPIRSRSMDDRSSGSARRRSVARKRPPTSPISTA